MEIVLLGTSAAMPTSRRHPTANAVIRQGEILLFDCGEGTQMQFQRVGLKPGKLTRIFISHFHGDHFYGLIGLLTSFQLMGRRKPLALYGPAGLEAYLTFMQKLSHIRYGYEILVEEFQPSWKANVWHLPGYQVAARPLDHGLFTLGFRLSEDPRPGKFDVQTAEKLGVPDGPERGRLQRGESVNLADGRVVHPDQVLGPEQPGKSLAICTDTRPCRNAVLLARGVDLLIHEGTFEGTEEAWAKTTGHSTVVQAAHVAQEAGARKLVLTHISQRYKPPDEARLLAQAQKIFPHTLIGHDLMRISI